MTDDTEAWIALGTIALAIATVALVVVTGALAAIAWCQIGAARRENRITQTLIACGQYDTSPVIFNCCKIVLKAKDDGTLERDAHKLRLQIMTILNFLDAIAIGVEQKLYDKDLVKDHMQSIIARQVRDLIRSPVGPASKCTPEHFTRLLKLDDEWSNS